VVSEKQERAIETRVRALGAKPSGGRGLLNQIVARVWEAVHKPRGAADNAVETALKALGVAEMEAGLYLAVNALARAVEDWDTSELAAEHLRQERAFADRLRSRISPTAARIAHRKDGPVGNTPRTASPEQPHDPIRREFATHDSAASRSGSSPPDNESTGMIEKS
jgi:hypothetical protein